MRVLISLLFTASFLIGCVSQHPHAANAGGGADPDDGVALAIVFLPIAVATSPIELADRGVRRISEIGDTKIYIPAGKTKMEVQRALYAVPHHRAYWSTHFHDGDEFLRASVGSKIFYARFHDDVTVDYDSGQPPNAVPER